MTDIWVDEGWEDWTTIKLHANDDSKLYDLMSKYKTLDYMMQQAIILKDTADIADIEPMYIMLGGDIRAIIGEASFYRWNNNINGRNTYYLNKESDIYNRGKLL